MFGNFDYSTIDSVVFQYSFDRDCNLLGNMQEASTLRQNLTELLRGWKIKGIFPWISEGLESLPSYLGRTIPPPGAKNMMNLRDVSLPPTISGTSSNAAGYQ